MIGFHPYREYPEMYMDHPELALELERRVEAYRKEHDAATHRKNHTGANEKHTLRELRKKECYELYDKMMKDARKMPVSEIKKVIAAKLHITTKTVSEYTREKTA